MRSFLFAKYRSAFVARRSPIFSATAWSAGSSPASWFGSATCSVAVVADSVVVPEFVVVSDAVVGLTTAGRSLLGMAAPGAAAAGAGFADVTGIAAAVSLLLS